MPPYDPEDKNDPNNPFSPLYRPKFIFERHVHHIRPKQKQQIINKVSEVEEVPVKNNPKLVIPYAEVDAPVAEIPFATVQVLNKKKWYMVSGNVSLRFNGEIKGQNSMLRVNFEEGKPHLALQFRADANKTLNKVSTNWDFDPADLNESSCTVTFDDNKYTSTSVSVTGGMPSIGTSSDDTGAGNSGVTFSPISPTSLTFHFDTEDFEAKTETNIVKGHLHLEVLINVMPGDDGEDAPAPTSNKVWNEIKSKIEDSLVNNPLIAVGGTIIMVKLRPTQPVPIISYISDSIVKALETQAPASSEVMPPPINPAELAVP